MAHPSPRFPTARDLDALNGWLERHGRSGLLLDGLHGLVTAALVGPEPVRLPKCLTLALGRPTAPPLGTRLRPIAEALYHGTLAELERGEYEPILGELADQGELTARGWCAGFALGVDLFASTWESRLTADAELLTMVEPIMRLAAADGVIEYDDDPSIVATEPEDYQRLLEGIAPAVMAIRSYWQEHPPGAETDAGRMADFDSIEEFESPVAELAAKRTLH